jgi:cytoskeletal protein RodZ
MKSVGQLLHADRNRKNISIEELSRATKIDVKYIEALEADRYDLLPSETFAKGFIRNLYLIMGSDPEELIAVFRRDYKHPEHRKSQTSHQKSQKFVLPSLSSQLLPIIIGVVVFVIYLGFQFRAILTPPPLQIQKPQSGSVLSSPVDIEGITSTDSLVTINKDNVIKPDQNGVFQMKLSIPVGETKVTIKTVNRFGRSQTTEIPLTIISN